MICISCCVTCKITGQILPCKRKGSFEKNELMPLFLLKINLGLKNVKKYKKSTSYDHSSEVISRIRSCKVVIQKRVLLNMYKCRPFHVALRMPNPNIHYVI